MRDKQAEIAGFTLSVGLAEDDLERARGAVERMRIGDATRLRFSDEAFENVVSALRDAHSHYEGTAIDHFADFYLDRRLTG